MAEQKKMSLWTRVKSLLGKFYKWLTWPIKYRKVDKNPEKPRKPQKNIYPMW